MAVLSAVVLAFVLLTPQTSSSQAVQVVNGAPGSLARFRNNDFNDWMWREHRESGEAQRRAVFARRMAIADQLDRLIADGDCNAAKVTAARAGYRDIREAVDQRCGS